MSFKIAISNQKGGVGKTTTAVSLSAQLAKNGHSVLLLDFDPQCSATSGLGVEQREGDDLFDLFFGKTSLSNLIVKTEIEGLNLVPSSPDLVGLEIELGKTPGRELILRSEIALLKDRFDFIFIDCPPSSGLLTLNALGASDYVLIPLQAEYYALEGITALMNTLEFVNQTFHPKLEILGVFLTMFDHRTNLSGQVLDEAKAFFKDRMFNTFIPRNVRLSEAPSHGKPICLYDPSSIGAKAYRNLAQEVEERCATLQSNINNVVNG